MKIENPKVTLEDDARIGVKEEVRSGFLDWLFTSSVIGEDGEIYGIGGSILSMNVEKLDLVTLNLSKGKGHSEQLKNLIYKIGKYPGTMFRRHIHNHAGALEIEKNEHSVIVTCGKNYKVECFDNVEGTFTNKDGTVRKLTGGNSELSIREWHQYPNILPRELYLDEETRTTKNEKISNFISLFIS